MLTFPILKIHSLSKLRRHLAVACCGAMLLTTSSIAGAQTPEATYSQELASALNHTFNSATLATNYNLTFGNTLLTSFTNTKGDLLNLNLDVKKAPKKFLIQENIKFPITNNNTTNNKDINFQLYGFEKGPQDIDLYIKYPYFKLDKTINYNWYYLNSETIFKQVKPEVVTALTQNLALANPINHLPFSLTNDELAQKIQQNFVNITKTPGIDNTDTYVLTSKNFPIIANEQYETVINDYLNNILDSQMAILNAKDESKTKTLANTITKPLDDIKEFLMKPVIRNILTKERNLTLEATVNNKTNTLNTISVNPSQYLTNIANEFIDATPKLVDNFKPEDAAMIPIIKAGINQTNIKLTLTADTNKNISIELPPGVEKLAKENSKEMPPQLKATIDMYAQILNSLSAEQLDALAKGKNINLTKEQYQLIFNLSAQNQLATQKLAKQQLDKQQSDKQKKTVQSDASFGGYGSPF